MLLILLLGRDCRNRKRKGGGSIFWSGGKVKQGLGRMSSSTAVAHIFARLRGTERQCCCRSLFCWGSTERGGDATTYFFAGVARESKQLQ